MNDFHPYSNDDLRHIRRLILACGVPVPDWAARLRRTADYLQSLSPGQAEIVAQQAQAIAADPDDYGEEHELAAVCEQVAAVPESERLKYVSRHVIEVRRRYFPGPIDEE